MPKNKNQDPEQTNQKYKVFIGGLPPKLNEGFFETLKIR